MKKLCKAPLLMVLLAIFFTIQLSAQPLGNEGSSSTPQDSVRKYTKEHPLVYEDAWDLLPYAFRGDNGVNEGYNVELVSFFLKELKIPYVIRLKARRDVLQDMKDGRADLTLGIYAPFHQPYAFFGTKVVSLFTHSVVWPKDQPQTIRRFDDLNHQKVYVHYGSFAHFLMKDNECADNAIPFGDMEAIVKKVSMDNDGQILWNTMSLRWLIRKNHIENLQIAPIQMPDGEYRFMSNDRYLLAQLDSMLAKYRNDETVIDIQNKWFYPERQTSGVPTWAWHVLNVLVMLVFWVLYLFFGSRIRENRAKARGVQRNRRLALVLQVSHLSIWLYDPVKHCFIWLDKHGVPVHTYTVEQFTSRLEKVDYDRLLENLRQMENMQKDQICFELHTYAESNPEGGVRVYFITLSVLRRDSEGRPSMIIAVCDDVTEKQEKQRLTKERLSRYRAVFNSAMVDMVYYDKDGNIKDMNERAQRTFLMDLEETMNEKVNLRQIVNVQDFDYEHFDIYHVVSFLNSHGEKVAIKSRKLKQPMIYELQLVPVRDKDGKQLCIYGSGYDITEVVNTYRQVQRNIKMEKAANEDVINYVKNINFVMGVGGVRMATYSPDTHMITIFRGLNDIQYSLTQTRAMLLTADSSKKRALKALTLMDNRTTMDIEAELATTIRAHDIPLVVQFRFVPTYDENGHVNGYFGMCRDVSAMKNTERLLAKETKRAQEVELLKNSFLRNMSYEIRTPLNTVVGFSELFDMEHSTQDEDLFIKEIKNSSAHLLTLINDILFLSRLDAHMIDIEKQPVDFAQTFEAHCEMGWSNYRKDGVRYIMENHYDRLVLNIDDNNIGRVIEQIVTNAAQHTTSGTVRARYDYIGEKLMIAIEDTGSGIDEYTLSRIYERFASGNHQGTGLGLPICKELTEQMGGHIDISSMVGKGTTVWITLPCEVLAIERKSDI